MLIRIFNYNTLEKVHSIEAHTGYIRSLAVHPTQPLLLSCGDDMVIKLWNWDNKWECAKVSVTLVSYLYSCMRVYICIRMWIHGDDMLLRQCICFAYSICFH